jgi:Tfp pilus assembly protein PilF
METLLQNMAKLNFTQDSRITEEMLTEVIQVMKKQKLSSISVNDLVEILSELKTDQNSQFSTPRKDAGDDLDGSFIFQSPKAVFPEHNPSQELPHKNSQPSNFQNEQSKLPGFFETARQSIPSDVRTPDKLFADYGFESTENHNHNKKKSPKMGTGFIFPEETAENQQTKKSKDNSAAADNNNSGAWFWGGANQPNGEEKKKEFPSLFKTQNNNFQFHPGAEENHTNKQQPLKNNTGKDKEKSTNSFETFEAKFTIGRDDAPRPKSAVKGSSSLSSSTASLNNIFHGVKAQLNQEKTNFPFIHEPSNNNHQNGGPESSDSRPTSGSFSSAPFKVFTVGATDILHSLDDPSPRPDSQQQQHQHQQPLEEQEEEMSVDEGLKSPPKSFTYQGVHENNISEQFKGLQLDEESIAFNLGATAPKTAKKSAMKRNQSAKKAPKATTTTSSNLPPVNTEFPKNSHDGPAESFNANDDNNNNNNDANDFDLPQYQTEETFSHHVKENIQNRFDNVESSTNTAGETAPKKTPSKSSRYARRQSDPRTPRASEAPKSAAKSATKRKDSSSNGDEPPAWWNATTSVDNEDLSESENEKQPSQSQAQQQPLPTPKTAHRQQSDNSNETTPENDEEEDDDMEGEGRGYFTKERPTTTNFNRMRSSVDSQDTNESERSLFQLAEEYSRQGKELYASTQYERALEAYDTCLKFAPKNWLARATILGNRAAVSFMLGRYIECVNDCDDAYNLDGTLLKLLIRKGKSLIKLGHLAPAETTFQKVLHLPSNAIFATDPTEGVAYQQLLDSVKLEAKAGLRELEKLKAMIEKLINMDNLGATVKPENGSEMLKIMENILKSAPNHRMTQITKCNLLLQMNKYQDCKECIEKIIKTTSQSILFLYAHKKGIFPLPLSSLNTLLEWKESNHSNGTTTIEVHLKIVVNFFLCIGSELAYLYLITLKNLPLNRISSAEMMTKVKELLNELEKILSSEKPLSSSNHHNSGNDDNSSWLWVNKEIAKMNELISLKLTADNFFKQKIYQNALINYTNALKIDKDAKIWNAILYSNRAATEMAMGLFTDAVNDCHNAIAKDSEYSRAYLRRARAYRSLNKFNDSVRDYRRYLCFDPIPSDFKDIQKELDEMIDLKAKEEKEYQQKQQQQHQQPPPPQRPLSGKGGSHSNNTSGPQTRSSKNRQSKDYFGNGDFYDNFNDFDDFEDLKVSQAG